MGKRRRSVSISKLTQQYKQRRKQQLKPPYECPFCWKVSCYVKKKKPFVLVYCTSCKQGEILPLHPVFDMIDYYCMVLDKYHSDAWNEPVFRFRIMSRRLYERLQNNITIGKIVVNVLGGE